MTTPSPGVLAFFIMYCEGTRDRPARSLFQEEIVRPNPGSRQISLEDFQTVVRDLVVNQELFDAMLRPVERPPNGGLPPGRSFKCLRGTTFALHQYTSGTAIRFFLMTDPTYSSTEAQRKLAAVYSGPWLDLVCRSQSASLRDILSLPVQLVATSPLDQPQPGAVGTMARPDDNSAVNSNVQQPLLLMKQQQQQKDAPEGGNNDNNDIGVADDGSAGEKHMMPSLPPAIHAALRTEVLSILKNG